MPPPKRQLKRKGEDDERSSARLPKKAASKKKEPTYDTYDEALDGGVEMEEKGERYRDGDKAQRFYERAAELYGKALNFSQTYDAAYNQARALYTLSTQFLLPPSNQESLQRSIQLYRQATTLTNSPLLRMDVGFNLAQACTSLADLIDDLDADQSSVEMIRALRVEARDVLQDVMDGQEEYLRALASNPQEEADDVVEGEAAGEGMDVDEGEKEGEEIDDNASATFETHLPTPSTFVDTVLALIDIHLSLWESTIPTQTPAEIEQSVVRQILDRASNLTPMGRQAEMDLVEIKVLLGVDSLVWDIFKLQARPDTGLERSLEGAVRALEAVLTSLEVNPPEDEKSVRAEILTTLADTHSTIANRMMFLNPQLPSGPSPLAQASWFHLSQSITHLNSALDLPTSAATPKEFKPSVLLSLSIASLARARLGTVNDTAKRNVKQLLENATTYAARAAEALGWNFLRINTNTQVQTQMQTPWQAGWEAELLFKSIILQQLRTCLYAFKTDLLSPSEQGSEDLRRTYEDSAKKILLSATKGLGTRALVEKDVQRWLAEIEDEEGIVNEEEKGWWSAILA